MFQDRFCAVLCSKYRHTCAHACPLYLLQQQGRDGVPVVDVVDTGGRGHPFWPSPRQGDITREISRPLEVLDFVHDRVI